MKLRMRITSVVAEDGAVTVRGKARLGRGRDAPFHIVEFAVPSTESKAYSVGRFVRVEVRP